MNLQEQVEALKDDRDVVQPFADRLLQRIQERFPGEDIRMTDIGFKLEIRRLNGSAQILRMLDDMIKESVTI